MKPWRKLIVTLLCILPFGAAPAAAQDSIRDSLEIHFRVGQSNLDLTYLDNRQQVENFVDLVNSHFANLPDRSLQMIVYGGASPEGPSELNRRLGEQRGIALKEVLAARLGNKIAEITVVNQGARWGALYDMINASDEPWKDEVLAILRKGPDGDNWKVDPREEKLRKMKGGSVWTQLNSKYLPRLRSCGSAAVLPVVEIPEPDCPTCCDTLVIKDTIIYLPEPYPVKEDPVDLSYVWALKTNFLLWGTAAPNGQVEFPLGYRNKWSLEAEVFWPWWIWNDNANAHQFGDVGLELRYWLGNRNRHHLLDGFHMGLGLGAGYYDTELEEHHGYQGEYLNAYLNFGYQHRFGIRKQWAVGGGIGIGAIPTNYREYLGSSIFPEYHTEERDYHLMWQKTSSTVIFGATHAHISLAYMFHTRSRKR